MAKTCDVPLHRVAGIDRVSREGDTGCANATGNLVLALEQARAGERVLVQGYGGGAGTVVAMLRATADGLGEAADTARAEPVELPYAQYLRHRGHLAGPPIPSAGSAFAASPGWERTKSGSVGLQAQRCADCGSINFPRRDYCLDCRSEQLEPALLPRRGRVLTYNVQHILPIGPEEAPLPVCTVLLEGQEPDRYGGKVAALLADADLDSVAVGMDVELVPRRGDNDNGLVKYGWKFHAAEQEVVMRPGAGLPVAVVGAGMIRFGERFDLSYEDMIVGAYRECLASVDNGIDEDRIEAAWLGTCVGSLIRQETVTGAALAEPLRFFPRPVSRVENACCTGSDAVRNAAMAIAAGVYDVVLVVGAEKMRDVPSRDSLIRQTGVMFHEWWKPRGATAPNRFGQYATAHMDAYGTTREHLALVAQKNHHNGSLNPNAFFRREITCEQVLDAPLVSWPLGLLDCCPTTDGAAAILLARSDIAAQFTDQPLYLRGTGLATDPLISSWKQSFTSFPATVEAARQAFTMAGIGPEDIDLAEVHDCFTITELVTYEDLGFCDRGAAGKWLEADGPMLGGELPVNTSGGLKAKGHPIGATGVAQVVELWEQLRGQAGDRQVDGARLGMTHNMGGIGTIVLINVFGTEPGEQA